MPRILSDWLTSFVEFSDYNTEPPGSFKLWTAISVIAAALQRKCVLQWDTSIYPNMYIVLVAPPGVRKGSSIRPGKELLREIGITMSSQSITREALIRELKEAGNHGGMVVSPDGQIHMHASLTIYSDELSVFLGHQNIALMSDLADWFDCPGDWTYRTKNQGTDHVVGVFVNIIGATTPSQIRTAIPIDLIGIGLSSRIIFVYEERKGPVCPAPFITPSKHRLREKLLNDLQQIYLLSGEFKLAKDFMDRYTEWYTGPAQCPAFNDTRFSGYFERRSVHLRKLCMIVNASRTDDMLLTAADLDRALDILTVTEQKMPMTFIGFGQSSHATHHVLVLQYLAAANKPVRQSELFQAFYRDMDLRTFETVIRALAVMGMILVDVSQPDAIISYNPRVQGDICNLLRGMMQ